MGMNEYQKLFIGDLHEMVTMWLDTQKRYTEKMQAKLKEIKLETLPEKLKYLYYKMQEYIRHVDEIDYHVRDNISRFKEAMYGQEPAKEESEESKEKDELRKSFDRNDYKQVLRVMVDGVEDYYLDTDCPTDVEEKFASSNMSYIRINGMDMPIAFDRERGLILVFDRDYDLDTSAKAVEILTKWKMDTPATDEDNHIGIVDGMYTYSYLKYAF